VTTFSKLLTESGKRDICQSLKKPISDIQMLNLHQINTEEQFSKRISAFLSLCRKNSSQKILIIQAQISQDSQNQAECARYVIMNHVQRHTDGPYCIVLVLQVQRTAIFSGFPGKQWKAIHIDELSGDTYNLVAADCNEQTLHTILESGDRGRLKALLPECVAKAASLAYRGNDLASDRLFRCIDILKSCRDEVTSNVHWKNFNKSVRAKLKPGFKSYLWWH